MPRIHEKPDTFDDVPESDLRFPSLGAGTDSMLPYGSQMTPEERAHEDELDKIWTERRGKGEVIDTRHPVERAIARVAVRQVSESEHIDVGIEDHHDAAA